MATCEWAILCDYAFLDVNRKLCLIGIFDRIAAPAVPATHHQAALALKLVGEPGERVRLRLEAVRPTGETLMRIEGDGELGEGGTAEIHMGMAGLPLPDYGIYAFNLYIGDELARSVALTVTRPPLDAPTR
jgi:uncharacterized protein DUF6941